MKVSSLVAPLDLPGVLVLKNYNAALLGRFTPHAGDHIMVLGVKNRLMA